MKKINLILLITLPLLFETVCAQQDIKLDDLKAPNSPGFQILDIAPSSTESPTNLKEFALKFLNLTNNGTALPKNFAFEFSPYWFAKPSTENVYKYLNLPGDKSITGSGTTGGIFRKLSVSIASSFSDSTSGSLLKNNNYLSLGIRTNILTIRTKTQIASFTSALSKISDRMHVFGANSTDKENLKITLVGLLVQSQTEKDTAKIREIVSQIATIKSQIDKIDSESPEQLEKNLDADKVYQDNIKMLQAAPVFQLDAAYAYSEAFLNNQYSDNRFNRSGLWLSATLSAASLNKAKTDNLSFIFLGRAIWDNALTDTAKNVFTRKNAYDFGGKIDYTIGRLSISFEHLSRVYSKTSSLNSNRTVGIIQYKINDNLYATGTYGENFGVNNLITLLGLNWGFGDSKLNVSNSQANSSSTSQ
jgi:hypothetical protein